MGMRAMGMRVRCFFFFLAVFVRVPMTVSLCDRMATWIALIPVIMAVVMIVPMGRRCVGRLWNPALLTYLCRYRLFVIVLSPTSFRMRHEPPQRGFIHVTRQRNA